MNGRLRYDCETNSVCVILEPFCDTIISGLWKSLNKSNVLSEILDFDTHISQYLLYLQT